MSCKKHIWFSGVAVTLFACLFSVQVQAQYDTTAYEVTDGEVAVEDETDDEEITASYFSSKNTQQPFSVEQRGIPEEALRKLRRDDDFWYANAKGAKKDEAPKMIKGQKGEDGKISIPPKSKEEDDYKPVGNPGWLNALLWIIAVGGFVIVLIWYLSSSNVGFFRRKDSTTKAEETGEEEMPEDIFAINYQREIDKAVAAGNYRLAIRLQYLRLLKNMAERHIISYRQDKTNFEYLFEMQQRPYYKEFFSITRHYEYSWYGKFNVSSEAYTVIQNDFNRLERQVNY